MSVFTDFVNTMQSQDTSIKLAYDCGNGNCVFVKRLMLHYTILLNEIGDEYSYLDRWCYTADFQATIAAAEEWQARGWTGEPQGWQRHPQTGRRRINGDPATEYINQ